MPVFRETIYIDEERKVMRLKQQSTKEWFNSYLTFQHIKEDSSRNHVTKEDKENMWLPLYSIMNTHNIPFKLRAPEEILNIIPQANFNFILNEKTENNNARLFEVDIFGFDKSPRREMADLCVLALGERETSIESERDLKRDILGFFKGHLKRDFNWEVDLLGLALSS